MSEIISIKEAKEAKKGAICGTVVKMGDLKSGTNNNGDWTMKVITLDDGSDMVDIAAFGDEIKLFKLGAKYELVSPWWKEKEGKLSPVFGKYCQIKMVSEPPSPSEAPAEEKKTELKITLDEDQIKKIQDESMLIYQIRTITERQIKTVEADPNPAMIGQFAEIIYNKHFKANFTKASDLGGD